ncbi:MAG: hypothetical protein ABGZ24_10655, partial [Fuerstiella sp.]
DSEVYLNTAHNAPMWHVIMVQGELDEHCHKKNEEMVFSFNRVAHRAAFFRHTKRGALPMRLNAGEQVSGSSSGKGRNTSSTRKRVSLVRLRNTLACVSSLYQTRQSTHEFASAELVAYGRASDKDCMAAGKHRLALNVAYRVMMPR